MPRKKRKYQEYMTLGTGPDGKRIRKYIAADTKTEFDRLKYEAIKEYELIRNPSTITFGSYARRWKEIYKSNTSIQTQNMYQYALEKCRPIDNIPLREITASDLQSIINRHADHPRSCQQLKLTMKQIYKAAIRDGIIPPFNLAEELQVPAYTAKEKRFISDTEMEKIDAINDWPHQDGLYVHVLRHTGMRPAEALALQWSDIDYSKHQIAVQRAFEFDGNIPMVKTTKTGRSRIVPLPATLEAELKAQKKVCLLIFHRSGQPYTKSAFEKLRIRILNRINLALGGTKTASVLSGLTLYSFRHTYATWIYYNAVAPGIITSKRAAQIMGHQEQIFLQRYTHVNEMHEDINTLRELIDRKKGDQKETKQA